MEGILRSLGAWGAVEAEGFLRHEGISVRQDGTARFEAYGADGAEPWLGLQAWRTDFDGILLERAKRAGVAVLQPCRAIAPLRDGGRVVGVRTTCGDLGARLLIDAAGGGHWLARALGMGIEYRSPPLIARYGYATGGLDELRRGPVFEAERDGWSWLAQVKPRLLHWTRLALGGVPTPRTPPDVVARFPPRGGARGADVTWRSLTRPAGPGFLVIGDAAAVTDPASSHGVLRALLTGVLAGECMCAEGSDERAVARLEDATRSFFDADVSALRRLYAGGLLEPPRWIDGPGRRVSTNV